MSGHIAYTEAKTKENALKILFIFRAKKSIFRKKICTKLTNLKTNIIFSLFTSFIFELTSHTTYTEAKSL